MDSISDQRVDLGSDPEKIDKSKYEPSSEVITEVVGKEEDAPQIKDETLEEKKPEPEPDLLTRIEKANTIKNQAAPLVKSGDYTGAIKLYEEAFFALKPSAKDREDDNFKKSLQLQNAIFNNLSLCYASLGRYRESVAYASRVLYVDKFNIKALFRVSTGLHKLGEHMKAYECIKECIAAHKNQYPGQPLDADIHKLYLQLKEICKDQIEEEKKKQKEVFSKMFGKQEAPNTPKKGSENNKLITKPVLYGLCSVPSLLMGFVVNEMLKSKGTSSVESTVAGALSGAGLFTGMVLSNNSTARSLLGLVPLGAFLAYQIFKKK